MSIDDSTEVDRMIRGELYSAADPYIRKIATQQAAKARIIDEVRDAGKRADF